MARLTEREKFQQDGASYFVIPLLELALGFGPARRLTEGNLPGPLGFLRLALFADGLRRLITFGLESTHVRPLEAVRSVAQGARDTLQRGAGAVRQRFAR